MAWNGDGWGGRGHIVNPDAYERATAAHIRANARKGRNKRWHEADPTREALVTWLRTEARGEFMAKMLENYDEWGHLTPRMEEVVRERMTKGEAWKAERAAEAAAAAPVPVVEGRMVVEGTILTVKEVTGKYGPTVKMLVKHDTGWKVWGTMPAALEADRGDRVRFEAAVTPSKDDPKFGFFARPKKAERIDERGGAGTATGPVAARDEVGSTPTRASTLSPIELLAKGGK